jgi:L-threonine synthase (EC 4.2.3.1)
VGVDALRIKHEGMNPTGSFKDRGMTVGVRVAKELGVGALACASTGNTSAALAAYGGRAGMPTLVLLPQGKVAAGKIAQASLHGARILEVDGNFDACLDIVQELAARGEVYLLNSLNPFRLEGQKTIGFEISRSFTPTTAGSPTGSFSPSGTPATPPRCTRASASSCNRARSTSRTSPS